MWKLTSDVAREMGVRTNAPFRDPGPTPRNRLRGARRKRHIVVATQDGRCRADFLPLQRGRHAENALSKAKDEKRFRPASYHCTCPACDETRL